MAFDGPNSVLFPGGTTDFVQSPTGLGASQFSGGMDLRFRVTANTVAGTNVFLRLGDGTTAAGNATFRCLFSAIAFQPAFYGPTQGVALTPALNLTAAQMGNPAGGAWLTIRTTYDATSGARVNFTSADNGATWTQINTGTVTTPAALATNPAWMLRALSATASAPLAFAWVDIRTIAGTPVAQLDLTYHWGQGVTSWTDPQGNMWELVGSGWSWQGPVPQPLQITTTSLPDATVGQPYTATLAATGGSPPYTWAVTQGALPAGLSLDPSTGVISGTPTQPSPT